MFTTSGDIVEVSFVSLHSRVLHVNNTDVISLCENILKLLDLLQLQKFKELRCNINVDGKSFSKKYFRKVSVKRFRQ